MEYFSRDAILTAVINVGNATINLQQERYVKSATPDLSDLIARGIEYGRTGSPDAVAQSGITRERLATIVEGSLRSRAAGVPLPLTEL